MKVLTLIFGWLQKLFAKSALTTIIIMFLAIIMAAIADKWLRETFSDIDQILSMVKLNKVEYWIALIVIFAAFLFAIKAVEIMVTIVLTTKLKEEE